MSGPSLSFVYAIYNRADLFARTLDTFALQDRGGGPYEIVVIDDGSTDDVRAVCAYYATRWGLPIRGVTIDVARAGVPVWTGPNGENNPTVAWNIGLREAVGEHVVISSPEVCHRGAGNLWTLATSMTDRHEALVADVYDREWADTEFGGWISGGPRERPLCFLARFHRRFLLDMGGFEEAFMAGRAYDDNEFAERFTANGGRYRFTGPSVLAEHLPHARAQPHPADAVNRATWDRLRGQCIANVGREWGNPAVVVDRWG